MGMRRSQVHEPSDRPELPSDSCAGSACSACVSARLRSREPCEAGGRHLGIRRCERKDACERQTPAVGPGSAPAFVRGRADFN
eukprot:CAMPEP_0206050026 /NCGR_PEP_ID=MMETSP1466-20131121/28195_1 /ASSEMBLY_ACC=CAM_ASM_001126 /TAXON_ID=44452 /ORGANISM="Pavlova gyrans, Strain CCMP608" /LENGTH=82 /DNA_ID=CAMNT_0053425131 /DNA_START=17 /DNA_END=265 /DNA_ORIENTATION=+